MTAGSAIAPRPQAVAPSPKGAYPGQPTPSAPSAGLPHRRRPLPSLTLGNKAAALALTLLALTFIPAPHAAAQQILPSFGGATIADQTYIQRVTVVNLTLPAATSGTPPLAYTLERVGGGALPIGLTFDSAPDARVLSGTPSGTSDSTYAYIVTRTLGGATDTITFRITVNSTFIFESTARIIRQTYTAGTPVSFTLPAATGGTPPLTYQLTGAGGNLPAGLAFDTTTHILSGTPTTAAPQALHTYVVTDSSSLSGSGPNVVITISEAQPPTFGTAIAPQTYPISNAVNVTLPAANDGYGALTYAINPTPPLPDGLTFTAATRVLNGTPTAAQAAMTYTYTATDSDPAGANSVPLTFTIAITDDPPVIVFAGGPSMTVDEGAMVTLDGSGSSDPEGQALTYEWEHTLTDGAPPDPEIMDTDAVPATFTFTTPDERTTLEFTLTVTDATGQLRMARLTVQVGRNTSERALEKTLAAFGRAFATGTVGVFEDYLSGSGASANTSHFTIGGHKFELATNTPAQTLDSRVASVRKPLTRQRTLTLENDGSVANTLSASYPQKYKSPSVSFPNDRKTGSDSDHVFHRIGNPANTTTMSAKDLLMKSAFHFNLNDDGTGTSGWSLWARATTTNFDGKPEDDFDLDGDVTSAYLGMDYQTPTGTRLGLAISETSGDVDYDDATDEAQGDLEADLTSILPYIQWQANDTTTAWAMLGYGEGDAELSTDDEAETTEVDIDMQMIALGISGDLTTYKRSEWSWKASAFAVELESEADEATDLPAVDANAQRLRAAIQGRVPGQASTTGAQFTPNWELGLRWDDGDAEQGGGADVGLGFNYTNPVNGLSVQGKTTFLVAHEAEDYEEWEASLQARLDSGVQGRGITFTLEPGWTADGRSQKMGMDFSNALGKWSKRGLRLELTGERTEQDDNDIGHNIRLTGSLRF